MKSPSRNVLTGVLLVVWAILMTFGMISLADPAWLRELSRRGIEAESEDQKNFGDNYLLNNDYLRAISCYQRALQIRPDYSDVMINMAIACSRSGRLAEAEELLRQALRVEGCRQAVAYFTLGEICENRGNIDEAVQYYLRASGSEIEPSEIYRKLGVIHFSKGEFERAKDAFEMLLACQTDPCSSYIFMLRYNRHLLDEAPDEIEIIDKIIADGISRDDLRRYDIEIFRLLSDSDPEIAKTHNHLGVICDRLGRIDDAVEHFEKSLSIWPNNPDAVRNLQILRTARENAREQDNIRPEP
jgi:protein O-GlcNAc transferase